MPCSGGLTSKEVPLLSFKMGWPRWSWPSSSIKTGGVIYRFLGLPPVGVSLSCQYQWPTQAHRPRQTAPILHVLSVGQRDHRWQGENKEEHNQLFLENKSAGGSLPLVATMGKGHRGRSRSNRKGIQDSHPPFPCISTRQAQAAGHPTPFSARLIALGSKAPFQRYLR